MKAKLISKFLLWGLAGFLLLTTLATGLVYFFQDKIIQLFVTEANQRLKTKVQVANISLSLFHKFPQVSVTLDQVQVMSSLPNSPKPLATAGKIFCTINPLDILRKKYQVREIFMENGEVHVQVLPNGEVNYQIFNQDTTNTPNEQFAFNLQQVHLKNVAVTYSDALLRQFHKIKANNLRAALEVTGDIVHIQAEGAAFVYTVQVDENDYFKNKALGIKTALQINLATRNIALAPSLLQVGPAEYEVAGTINYTHNNALDLTFKGKNTSIQSVLALLPEKQGRHLGQYRSSGGVYFSGQVKGILSPTSYPLVTATFNFRNASFYQPEYKQKITNIYFDGSYTNGPKHNSVTSVLALKNFRGILANRPVKGYLIYRNFKNPYLDFEVKADVDIAHVLGIFPVAAISSGSGRAKVALAFAGPLKLFRATGGSAAVKANGDITLQNAALQLSAYRQPFRRLNGNFLIRKNDMAVTNFTGFLGDSDFLLNGYFKNVLGWLFLKNQGLRIEADVESRFLNFDRLLSSSMARGPGSKNNSTKKSNSNGYRLIIPPHFSFDVNASVGRLQFRRFKGEQLRGNLQLNNRIVSSRHLAMNVSGGKFSLQGRLDARSVDNIKITTYADLVHIKVDSLFYVFEDFGQNFIRYQHLKGELTAQINSDLYFDSRLNAKTDQLEAEIKATVRNGQLLNFEPMQKLSTFLKRRELTNIRFAELSNNFWIQKRTVYIPEMEIRSDLSRASVIGVQGTHTFDQEMDYKFRIPLVFGKRRDKTDLNSPITPVSAGSPNLFLTLKGNEKDYKVAYDKVRVKNKIAMDTRREKVTFKEILKDKKPEKKKEVQLQTGEYFDF